MENKQELLIDWIDSGSLYQDRDGNLKPAGTCLLLNNSILFLTHYSEKDLLALQHAVNQAVEHELSIRKRINTI